MQKLSRSPGSNVGRWFFLLFGGLWTGISCCVGAGIVGGMASEINISNPAEMLENPGSFFDLLFPTFFIGIFVLVGLIFLVVGIIPMFARTRISAPEVSISNANLRSGESFALSYQQNFKSGVDVEKLMVQLLLRESATYRRGTDTVTVTHDHVLQTFEEPARHFDGGQQFVQNFRWEIPRGAMHSFQASRNKLYWIVKVKVDMKGWPDYDEEFGLTVRPEVLG
jgi:hypothetical protein